MWQRGLRLPANFGKGDVLVLAGNPRFLSNLPLLLRAKLQDVSIVWWGHGWSSTSGNWSARIRYRLMNLADVVLVYADAEIPKLRPYLTPRQYVTATNNSLEPSAMLAAQAAWAPRLKEFEGEQGLTDKHLLLFCGRLRPGSQVDVLIRALAYAQVTDNVVLAIIGSGQEEADLRALAEELGVNGSIKWLGAHYEESFLAPWFGLSKCFVYPGSIGLSLLHAFTYGVPVVTHSDTHLHNPEIHALVNRHNGLTFKRGDPRSLWQAITEMIGDDSLRNNLAMKAYVTAHEEWSFARTVHRLVNAVVTASRRGSTHR